MADEKKTARQHFDEGLSAVKGGIAELDHAGVPKKEAAEISAGIWRDAQHAAREWPAPIGAPPQGDGGHTKEQALANLKADVARFGITADEVADALVEAGHDVEGHEAGPKGRKKKPADTAA